MSKLKAIQRAFLKKILPLLVLIGATTYVVINPSIITQFTQNVIVIAAPDGTEPDVVICNSPVDHLPSSTRNAIENNARSVCLAGLTIVGGPPILGDANGFPVINPAGKFSDVRAVVTSGVLICQVPCSNPNAREIKTCYDFSNRPAPASFSIRAQSLC